MEMPSGIGAGVPAGQPTQAPTDIDNPDDAMPNVSPEEQAQYDQFVENGMEVIYPADEPGSINPAILANLQGQFEPQAMEMLAAANPPIDPQSPTDALAATIVMLVLMLEASAEQSGAQIGDDIVLHGGAELLGQLAEIAEATKAATYSEQDIQGATYRAADLYRTLSPRVDQAALTQEFEQIRAADQAGTLGQVLPGIEKQMKG